MGAQAGDRCTWHVASAVPLERCWSSNRSVTNVTRTEQHAAAFSPFAHPGQNSIGHAAHCGICCRCCTCSLRLPQAQRTQQRRAQRPLRATEDGLEKGDDGKARCE